MNRRSRKLFNYSYILLCVLLLLPVWMWLAWHVWPKSTLNVVIVDKTVVDKTTREHASLNWILRNEKYSKENGNLYVAKDDYYGFFPKKRPDYEIEGLERLTKIQLNRLTQRSDMIYFADTYGVYENDLVEKKGNRNPEIIYGGLSTQDMYVLKRFKQQKKLIITEFNTFATPTVPNVAKDFENTFKIRWTGWVGRYFDTLDTLKNKELPRWLIKNYKAQNNNKWPFSKSGIVFVHRNEKILVLEYVTHLNAEVPFIVTRKNLRKKYGIPRSIKYPFWFDVVQTSIKNQIVSFYDIKANEEGKNLLVKNGIPPQFPAVIEHDREDYKFYYFCGDFADNPVSQSGSYFKGIRFFRKMFYKSGIASERVSFFWEFYSPLVTSILKGYEAQLPGRKTYALPGF